MTDEKLQILRRQCFFVLADTTETERHYGKTQCGLPVTAPHHYISLMGRMIDEWVCYVVAQHYPISENAYRTVYVCGCSVYTQSMHSRATRRRGGSVGEQAASESGTSLVEVIFTDRPIWAS
jgi:hypothetical protein